jgi:hypothetical protein
VGISAILAKTVFRNNLRETTWEEFNHDLRNMQEGMQRKH